MSFWSAYAFDFWHGFVSAGEVLVAYCVTRRLCRPSARVPRVPRHGTSHESKMTQELVCVVCYAEPHDAYDYSKMRDFLMVVDGNRLCRKHRAGRLPA